MENAFIFDIPFLVDPIINVLVIFYHALEWLHIPYALGFAIVLLTVFVRLLMYPLTTKQLQMSKKMQELAPHMSKIKDKHKGDMRRQQEATMALYKEHNLNPAAGCLPGLVQIVVLIFGLYPALLKVLTVSGKDIATTVNERLFSPALHLTSAWNTDFFGLELGKTPADLYAAFGIAMFAIPVITGGLQFIQSKMMLPAASKKAVSVKDSKKPDDFATMFQKQSLYILPFMIGFFSWYFSVGLSLYWNTFTIFGIIQQYKVAGLGGVADWVAKLRKKA